MPEFIPDRPSHLQEATRFVSDTDRLDSIIEEAAKKHGIDPALLKAVGEQETGLGKSSVYDPVTGRSKTKGNNGYGIWQLDASSGAPQSILDRVARDPAFAADIAAKKLAGLKAQFGGDTQKALAAYNAGAGNVQAGMGYASQVLARMPASPERLRGHLQLLSDHAPSGFVPDKPGKKNSGFVPDSKPQPQPQGIHLAPSAAQQVAGFLDKHGLAPAASALRTMSDMADNPIAPINAVLGAPQRFVAGALAADQRAGGAGKASLLDEARGALYGVFHPNDQSYEQQASQLAHVPHSNDPRFRGKVQNFASDLGFQTVTDPLTYLGGAGLLRHVGDNALEKAGQVTEKALQSEHPLVRKTATALVPNPEARLAFTKQGYAAVHGITESEAGFKQKRALADAELLAKYKKDIRSGQVPDELRQRLLSEAFTYGTPKMRTQALLYGYKPTLAEMSRPPEGILNYDLKEDYFPHVGQNDVPDQLKVFGKEYLVKKPSAGFEKHQLTDALPINKFKAMDARLAMGRAAVAHRMAQKRIAEETGLAHPDFGIQQNPDLLAQNVRDPQAAQNLLERQPKTTEGLAPAQALSRMGREGLISFFAPHGKNVSTLAFLAGGPTGLAKGAYYALSGVPKSIMERLERGGAGSHFLTTAPKGASPAQLMPHGNVLGKIPVVGREWNQQALDRIDMGMRAARLEQLDKEYGNSISEFEKMRRVNEDIGDYQNSPAYVDMAKNLGAMFPQWHGYIVPTAVARAVLRAPQRVMGVARAEDLGNKDVVQGNGYTLEAGGPVEEFGSAISDPARMAVGERPKYFGSPSITGPIGGVLTNPTKPDSFDLVGRFTSTLANYLPTPYRALAEKMGYNPYNSNASDNVRALSSLFGAYPKAEQSAKEAMIRSIMEWQRMSRNDATRVYDQLKRAAFRH